VLEGLRLEHSKVIQIVKLLAEGLGVRGTARVTDCDPHTVLNVLETIGPKVAALHDRIVRNVQTDALQIDELWSRVFCSQKHACHDEHGDQYSYLALKAGAPRRDRICTSHVERANLSVRHFNKRFARLSLGYSKTIENHRHALALFVFAYNFCKVHSTLGCTPAVGLKLATETWTIERLIEEAAKDAN
jgi:IS1 family transposase